MSCPRSCEGEGVPPVLVLAGGRGYPLSWSWLGGCTVLGPHWGTPSPLLLPPAGPWTWPVIGLGVPPSPWERIWDQRLGVAPLLPLPGEDLGPETRKGTWNQRPWGTPLPLWTDKQLKTLPSLVLRTQAVIMKFPSKWAIRKNCTELLQGLPRNWLQPTILIDALPKTP